MKLGPCHVFKDATVRRMQEQLDALHAKLRSDFWNHSYQHYPVNIRTPPAVTVAPDKPTAENRQVVERVVAAYQRAKADGIAPEPGLWDLIQPLDAPFRNSPGSSRRSRRPGTPGQPIPEQPVLGSGTNSAP